MSQRKSGFFIHPSFILLFLLLASISFLFLAMSISYVYIVIHSGNEPIALPILFYLNTFVLMMSSLFLWKAKAAYLDDDTEVYQRSLLLTFILSLVFLVSQAIAWFMLFKSGILLTHSNLASFIYSISALHFLHVAVGIPILYVFMRRAYKRLKSPVSVLLYFSDLDKKRGLDLLHIYWHYLDGLWLYLMIVFLGVQLLF